MRKISAMVSLSSDPIMTLLCRVLATITASLSSEKISSPSLSLRLSSEVNVRAPSVSTSEEYFLPLEGGGAGAVCLVEVR